MSVSTLSSTLDVQELSQKLSILEEEEEREKGKEGKEGKEGTSQEESETSVLLIQDIAECGGG